MTKGGGGGNRHFRDCVLAIFHIFGVNVEKIKRRIVQKVWVMDIRCEGKVVRNDVLDMCTKILELYDSHC